MATITGLTKERMLQIEGASVTGGMVDEDGLLILTRHDGTIINAGSVVGPEGPPFTNGVDTVSDQLIDGFKAFRKKTTFQPNDGKSAVRIGTAVAGQGDALNITPVGPASVVFASGAEREEVDLISRARAASATQIELLNSTVNIYANTGLVAGNAYVRTKVLSIDHTGMLVLTRPAAGPSIWIQKEAASMGAGSILIGRSTPATQAHSLVFSGGVAYNSIIGRKAGSDNLLIGYDGGGGFVETVRIAPDGSINSIAQVHQFGIGAFNISGAYLRIDGTATEVYIRAFGSAISVPLYIQPQSGGILQLRNGAGEGILTVTAVGQVDVNVGAGGAISAHGLNVLCSPNGGYGGIRVKSNWGAGGGGNPFILENAVGKLFDFDANGTMEWGPGANIAGVFVANATAGGGQATPASVVGFMRINVNGTTYKVPYYAN